MVPEVLIPPFQARGMMQIQMQQFLLRRTAAINFTSGQVI